MSYKHEWQLSDKTTPSGKVLFHCPVCGLYDPAPVKEKFEMLECIPRAYVDKLNEFIASIDVGIKPRKRRIQLTKRKI